MAEQKASGFVIKKNDEISRQNYYCQESTLVGAREGDKIIFRTRCETTHWGLCGGIRIEFESKAESIQLWDGKKTKTHTTDLIVYFQRFSLVQECHKHFLTQLLRDGFKWKAPCRKDLEKFEECGSSSSDDDVDMDSGSESDSD
jgi:hypothetical protein